MYKRQDEWLGLKRNHPELFEKARQYEQRLRTKYDWKDGEIPIQGHGYTWSSQGTIDELVAKAEKRQQQSGIIATTERGSGRWQDALKQMIDDDPEDQACLVCSL